MANLTMPSFGEALGVSSPIRAALNIGGGFDIPTGYWTKGKYGESILNGGLAPFTTIVGKGNTFKTAIAIYMMLAVLDRYTHANAMHYDTELTFNSQRLINTQHHHTLDIIAALNSGRIHLTDESIAKGNQWFRNSIQDYSALKAKSKVYGTLPIVDVNGNPIKYLIPTVNIADSISEMKFDDLEKNYAKMDIGQGEMQTEAMRVSNAKRMLIEKTQGYCNAGAIYTIMTGHLGEELNLDGKPKEKKTTFMKQGEKLSKIPNQMMSLPNNVWKISTGTPLIHKESKEWLYPNGDNNVDSKGVPDLISLRIENMRGKAGGSGIPWEIIMSQSEGLLPSLTEYNLMKNANKYGIQGNDRFYQLELLPDITMQRTTLRKTIDSEPLVRRALNISAEMLQMRLMCSQTIDARYRGISPGELYKGLKEKGYDWEVLLNTRGWYNYLEDDQGLPYLSSMDLLRMYYDEYKPYWL